MQQNSLKDTQKVSLINSILNGDFLNSHEVKSRLYIVCCIMKSFDRLDLDSQLEIINPVKGGILDYVFQRISSFSLEELKEPLLSKSSLYDQLLTNFGVMLHGLYSPGIKAVTKRLLQNLLLNKSNNAELFILDLFELMFNLGRFYTILML